MKKFFKWLLISLGGLLALYFIIGLFAPSTYKVERSKNMIASPEVVYDQISNLRNWEHWTAWAEMDTTTVNTYEGADGAVGSIMRWKSKDMGEGNVEITELVPNEKITYKLTFVDWNSVSTGAFAITKSGDSTNVVWTNEGEISYLMRTMVLFMGGMDAMMGPDFEKGLSNLGKRTQDMKPVGPEIPDYVIQEISFPGSNYIGIRFDTLISAVDSLLFGSAYEELGIFAAENKLQMTGAPVSITYSWDEKAGRCDLMPAFPVAELPKTKNDRIQGISVAPSKALCVDYYGDYMQIWMAHMAIDAYRVEHNLKTSVCIESYETDPTTVPSYDSVLTKVYYILD